MQISKKGFIYIALAVSALCLCEDAQAGRYTQIPISSSSPPVPKTVYSVRKIPTASGIKKLVIDVDGIIVRKGDTLYSISKRHNVPMRALIRANRLSPPYDLKIGQRLKLPDAASHIVAKGDTLYSVSRKYNVDMKSLASLNNMSEPYNLSIGQKLYLPSSLGIEKVVAVSPPASVANHDIDSIVERWLSVPDNKTQKSKQKRAKKQKYTKGSANKKFEYSKPVAKGKAKIAAKPKKKAPLPRPEKRSSSKFEWPVKGKVISEFGTVAKGQHNDGVNIKTKEGAFIKAAENGVVAYAGNEIKGFGNLLLIKHSGGWMTAYAHNSKLVVKRGQKVKRGEVVAKAGSTGNVKTPQLHFEVRAGKKAVNPLKYMSSNKL